MFDFSWSEIVVIGGVALIAIGPKDLPVAIKTVSNMVKKARKMASEFQTHVDEMVREADLGDVKTTLNDVRNMNLSVLMEKTVDPDNTIRNAFADNPLAPGYGTTAGDAAATDLPEPEPKVEYPPADPRIPAFIPPQFLPALAAEAPPEPPAFVPPAAALQRQR
jgi:sec-independent protein translocase protein TatB